MTLLSKKLACALFVLCATAVKAVEDTAGYVNPCNEFDTATLLNELYYNTPTGNSSDDDNTTRPSYYDSGFFVHTEDPGGGNNDVTFTTMTPGKFLTMPTANSTFMIGSDNLLAPVCPVDVTTDGEYPWYCPTPLSIDPGAISFSYIRADIQPPVSILNEYLKTGIDPYTNSNNTPTPGIWPGQGYIFAPNLFNPEIPIDDSHKYAFWDNNRVGNSWSTDGSSWNRIDCGNGISFQELLLGNDNIPFNDAGPAVDPETDVIMQCSPPTVEWQNYASKPKGWDENKYCPDETYADYQTYIEYNYNKVSTYLSSITLTSDDCTLGPFSYQTEDFNNKFAQCEILRTSQSLMCGIPPSKFDSVYIPAQKYENWPKEREELASEFILGFATRHRETTMRPWNGVGFNEFGQHLVFYANYDNEESVQEALGHANDFYEKSQLNGGSPIRIPVVIMNTDNMWLQDDDDDNNKNGSQSPPFTCPSTSTTSATTTTSSANSNSSVGADDEDFASSASFLVGNISTLLSSVFVAAVLYSC